MQNRIQRSLFFGAFRAPFGTERALNTGTGTLLVSRAICPKTSRSRGELGCSREKSVLEIAQRFVHNSSCRVFLSFFRRERERETKRDVKHDPSYSFWQSINVKTLRLVSPRLCGPLAGRPVSCAPLHRTRAPPPPQCAFCAAPPAPNSPMQHSRHSAINGHAVRVSYPVHALYVGAPHT